ncbi:MAG: hypothetical protein LUG60_12215 [Erysipelotrichaceae bacterium]|nr:hypothetical protein [Erysipelotrichaceae bacterium]
MDIYKLGKKIETITLVDNKSSQVIIVNSHQAMNALAYANITYDGDIQLSSIRYCRVETQEEYMSGSLYIPKLLDVSHYRYKILIFINKNYIVIVDDSDFSKRIMNRLQMKILHHEESKELFLYHFFIQILNRDSELLSRYKKQIMDMEEKLLNRQISQFQNHIMPLKKELLTLREYYDEIMDNMAREFRDNENDIFEDDLLKYFGNIYDRADRLVSKTSFLLEYARQISDAYQAQLDTKQNNNMQVLTVISTIFLPLSLITSWYGMNFENMPELESGYPYIILLSLIVIVVCILIFKIKNII